MQFDSIRIRQSHDANEEPSMTHTTFSRRIRRHYEHCLVIPVETGGTALGVPDLFLRTLSGDMWIELKVPPDKLRPMQRRWRVKYCRLGGVYALIEYGDLIKVRLGTARRIYTFTSISALPKDLYAWAVAQ